MTEIAAFLKYKRKELGLTQEELALKAGVGIRFIRKMEQGKESLQLNKVNQVLSLFGFCMSPTKIGLNPYEIALNFKNDARSRYFKKAVKITLKNRIIKYGFIMDEIIDLDNHKISGWKFLSNSNALKYQKNRDNELLEIISHADIQNIEAQ